MIKKFNEFNSDDNTLYIFDLDDTLVSSPHFENLALQYIKESNTVEDFLHKSLRYIGVNLTDLKKEHGRIYVPDPDHKIVIKGNWVRKKSRVYLISPDGFYYTDDSLPTRLKPLSDLYKKVKNKAIITGRISLMKEKLEEKIKELGLESPNHGFFCYPQKNEISERVGTWKARTIVNLIKEKDFKSAVFYDDNKRWVRKVDEVVKETLPDITWKAHIVR